MTLSLPLESPQREPPAWLQVQKANPRLVALADRHYTRQKPGTPQFCRPGTNFPLLLSDGSAGWVTWRPIPQLGRMDGLEAWECTFFRNEGACTSSDLIREATELTYRAWGWPPRDGLITAVGIEQTSGRRSKKHPPGWCFICAGWQPIRERDGKAWLLAPPPERQPIRRWRKSNDRRHPVEDRAGQFLASATSQRAGRFASQAHDRRR